MLHGSSTTWFQTSHYCRAKVEFNSIRIEFGTVVARPLEQALELFSGRLPVKIVKTLNDRQSTLLAESLRSFLDNTEISRERGKRKGEKGKRKEERGKGKKERGKRKKEEGKRKEERGKRKEEAEKS